jgi:hypothetical protein
MSQQSSDDVFMHESAHCAWKSSAVTDPVTKSVLGYHDQDRFQFSNFSMRDSHADICLMDKLTRPSLKDHKCSCDSYLAWCQKSDVKNFKVRAANIKRNARLQVQ